MTTLEILNVVIIAMQSSLIILLVSNHIERKRDLKLEQTDTLDHDLDEIVRRRAIESEIDNLYEKITIIHGRIANLEKRVEPIGFQEVLTKHADEIAVICCREYSKLFQNGHDERRDADNNG